MYRAVTLALAICLISLPALADDKVPALCQDQPEQASKSESPPAVEILKKADSAAKAVNAVQYDVVVNITGDLQRFRGPSKASIIATGYNPPGIPEKYSVDTHMKLPCGKKEVHLTGGTDGETYFLINHEKKTAHEKKDPAVMGQAGKFLLSGMMIEFVTPEPFTDEIKGKSQKITGSKVIAGEDCYEIHVIYAVEKAPEAVWYISKKDFLPRARIDKINIPNEVSGTIEKSLSNLKVDPKLDKETFKLKLPKDYQKTDKTAPDLTR